MADIIEINISVVDKGNNLEKAVTKTQTLQTKLKRLAKEIDAGAVSDKKRSQTLIALGRELKKVTDYTGQKAYGEVKKYLNAQLANIEADKKAIIQKERLAKVEKYLAERAKRTTAAIKQQAVAVNTSTTAVKRYESTSRKGMRRVEILAQQTGYQLGDLAVQIQSGTNAAVAFGQQGSQLLGFFGPAGALAGAGLAITTAFIAPMLKAKQDAENFEKALEDLADASDRLSDSFENQFKGFSELTQEFGKGAEKAQELLELQRELSKVRADKALGRVTKTLVDEFDFGEISQLFPEDFLRSVESTTANIDKLILDLEKIQELDSKDLTGRFAEQLEEITERIYQLENMENVVSKIANEYKITEPQAKKLASAMAGVNSALDATERSEALLKLANSIKFATDNFTKGDDAAYELYQQVLDAAEAALKISKNSEDMDEPISDAAAAALELSKNLGVSLGLAEKLVAIAAMGPEQAKFNTKISAGLIPPQAAGDFDVEGGTTPAALQTYMDQVDANVKAREQAAKEAEKAARQDPVKKLEGQLALEKALVGQTEARQRVMQALGVEFVKNNPKVVAGLEEQINAINAAKEADEQRLAIQQTIEGALEDGFMSMIDGTKSVQEAFKDMARQVIAELYRILVVKKMVAAITSALPFADGGVFQGGSQVKAFANGGVVGGPTYFPMSGGRTGLMGEAGPEAIMPLKRGKDGKLGVAADGGGGVTINQTFAFQANGDDSVKKIIAQAAPKIAAMTQQQIMDSRRRGGQMKQVFG